MRGGQVDELIEEVGQRHSERLLPMVQELLAQAGAGLHDLDAIAFGAGPGSFTGLRIACGAAQGLAFGLALPVLPVGNLRALAAHALQSLPQAKRIGVAIDARMSEIYWAVYEVDNGVSVELVAPSLSSAVACAAELDALGVDALAGNALSLANVQWPQDAERCPQARASAGAMVRLAALDWQAGRAVPAAQAAPVYVRDRVALTIDERRAGLPMRAGAA